MGECQVRLGEVAGIKYEVLGDVRVIGVKKGELGRVQVWWWCRELCGEEDLQDWFVFGAKEVSGQRYFDSFFNFDICQESSW